MTCSHPGKKATTFALVVVGCTMLLTAADAAVRFDDDDSAPQISGRSASGATNSSATEQTVSGRQGKAILFGDPNGNPPAPTASSPADTEEIDARINVGAPAFQNNFQQQQQFPAEYYTNYYQPQQGQQGGQGQGQGKRRQQQQQQRPPYYPTQGQQGNLDRTELYYPNGAEDVENETGGSGGLFGLGLFERFDVERSLVAPAVSGLVTAGVILAAAAFLGPVLGLAFPFKATEKSDAAGDVTSAREGRSFKNVFRDRYPDWYNTIAEINPLELSLKWMKIERDECRRRNICEFQNRAGKFPLFGKFFRAIFQRFAPRYIDAVDAADRTDVSCDRLYTCSYGLRGLIDRIKGRLHSIFGKKNRV